MLLFILWLYLLHLNGKGKISNGGFTFVTFLMLFYAFS